MEFEPGKIIINTFTIDKISINGKVAEIGLINGTTQITGILKDNVDLFSKTYLVGEQILCKGRIRKRRKYFCLDLIYVSKNHAMLEAQITMKFDYQSYVTKFDDLIESIKDEDYKKILDNCFNEDVRELFFTYPAAESNHHNYEHGLLQHSVDVVELSLAISKYASNVSRDLIICAGLLHDIGKLKSYDVEDGKTTKSDWEHLLGHLPISALFVSKIIPPDCDQKKVMLLYHCVLSHHGELSHGSPIVCKIKEAHIINKADEISSSLNHIESLTYKGSWSEEDKSHFKRTWYRSEI